MGYRRASRGAPLRDRHHDAARTARRGFSSVPRTPRRRARTNGARTAWRRLPRPRRGDAHRKSLVASRSFGRRLKHGGGWKRRFRSIRRARPKRCAGRISRRQASRSGSRPTASNRPNGNTAPRSRAPACGDGRHGQADRGGTGALGIIFKPGYRYKKAGITFLDLVAADRVQGGLFDRPDDARSIRRMRAVDLLNARYGRGAVGFGTAGVRHAWGLRREFVSPRYTTVWDELLRV